jgi:hypothetical protein
LTELDNAEAILGFGSRCPNILVSNIELSDVDNWLGHCIYGLVVQGYHPPMDS